MIAISFITFLIPIIDVHDRDAVTTGRQRLERP